jgi:chitin disaccharide deacetylase
MKLLFESDDYGISEGVTCGILRGIRQGLIRNTGLFVNMPGSEFAVEQIKQYPQCCLGIDFNLVSGYPISDPARVTALVRPSGEFFTSTEMRMKARAVPGSSMNEVMEEDPYPFDQTLLEIENQYLRFVKLTGKKPGYLHGHSFVTQNILNAITVVSEKYQVPASFSLWEKLNMHFITNTWNVKPFPVELQLNTNVEEHVLQVIPEVLDHDLSILICHAGFVDEDLFHHSTFTIIRQKDLQMACSPRLAAYLEEHQVKLVTYGELDQEV